MKRTNFPIDQPLKPADYLDGKSELERIPIVRSLEEQHRIPVPHLMIFPDGQVLIFTGERSAHPWNPVVPLRKQL